VLWAQEHLSAAGFPTTVDGDFGAKTQESVAAFQGSRGLPATGEVDTATWKKLLEQVPQQAKKKPKSADLPAKRREIR
jgi:carboxyl-terminal processing protease